MVRRVPIARRLLRGALGLYAVLLASISLASLAGPDRWAAGAAALYLPQWLWALPAIPLALWCWGAARRWLWAPALCALWVAGPVMGLRWSLARGAPEGAPRLRVMTMNVKAGFGGDSALVLEEVRKHRPDLLLLQDIRGGFRRRIANGLPGSWSIAQDGQYLVASRWPVRLMSRDNGSGRPRSYVRCRVNMDGREIAAISAHLASPRWGLLAVRRRREEALEQVRAGAELRFRQADSLAEDTAAEMVPSIVGGDLNAPPPSLVCRRLERSGLRDAFAEAGRGYGYTYGHAMRLRHSFLRIDHVYVSPEWRVLRCWTGGAAASPHRAVIADLALTGPE